MPNKRGPDCPCCSHAMVYSYDPLAEKQEGQTIVCNGCNSKYELSAVELGALDYFMRQGDLKEATAVLMHAGDLSKFQGAKKDSNSDIGFNDLPLKDPDEFDPAVDKYTSIAEKMYSPESLAAGACDPTQLITPYGPNPNYTGCYGHDL